MDLALNKIPLEMVNDVDFLHGNLKPFLNLEILRHPHGVELLGSDFC